MSTKPPFINCHTHIFTGDHVPPYLAKTFLPAPLYHLLPLSLIVKLFRFWYNNPYTWQFKPWYKNIQKSIYKIKMLGSRTGFSRVISFIIGLMISFHALYILYDWLYCITKPTTIFGKTASQFREWLTNHSLLFIPKTFSGKIILLLLLLVFFKSGRNIIFLILKKIWSFLGVLPGPKSKELIGRYLNIGRFAFYKQQARILGKLKSQYPEGTGIIILPMDMEYMGAGKLKNGFQYVNQMEALKDIKNRTENKDNIFPFVFADPRRMVQEGTSHFNYTFSNGKVTLGECFIKDYIEDNKFNGFKIYPALGYYPFDETLLPLWKYAADNALPITTHCIRGTIYYRGNKKKEWDAHPVFQQSKGDDRYEPLSLLEIKNSDFINNFTHPLNYLCLLEEKLLRKLVQQAKNESTKQLFGYTNPNTELKYNLSHLKLCFAHFGGDDEWNRFMEKDRDNYASQLIQNPLTGITFFKDKNGNLSHGKLEQIWKYADWYSIICSLMLQYENTYADLSYIIHNPDIQPLLKQTLINGGLKQRVLFGTDFYVVRNHKSEKSMLADMAIHLTEEDFDQIARINPRNFLNTILHGPVKI